jgi:hypothetical protein
MRSCGALRRALLLRCVVDWKGQLGPGEESPPGSDRRYEMRRICSFVPAAIVTGAAQSRPGVDVPSRARRRGLRGGDPVMPRVDAVPVSPRRPSTEPGS